MWNTLTAGLQLVQQRLDHVMEDVAGQHAGKDTTQNVAAVDSPDGATSLERSDETPSLTQAPLTSEVPQSPPGVTVSQEEEEVRSLREALRSSEDQVQLIHSEYRSICREKDDTIRSLKAALEQTGEHQRGEAVEKELEAHKEMVVELRRQLEEKENDLQELNLKAEAKFNKLKNQAKGKITALSRELEQLKGGKGDTHLNTSQALEDSLGSGDPSLQQQLDDVAAQLGRCKEVIASLEGEKLLLLQEREEQYGKAQAAADELAKAQVLLQREQETCLSVAQEVAAMEGQLEQYRRELSGARAAHEQDQQLLEQEREQYRALRGRLVELGFHGEGHGDMQRGHSSASSDVQVVSAALSQLDSEEEWKLIPSGSGNSSGGKGGPYSPPEIAEMPAATDEQRVIMTSGDKTSLVDLESELARQEMLLREREEELSTIRGALELRDSSLRRHEQQTAQLSELCRTQKMEVDQLKVALEEAREASEGAGEVRERERLEKESLQERCKQLEVELGSLRDIAQHAEATRKGVEQQMQDKEEVASKLLVEVEEARRRASEAEQEAARLIQLLEEAQLAHRVLQESLDGDTRACAEKLDKQIEDLGLVNVQLQAQLEEKEIHIQQLLETKASLEQGLLHTRESLQGSEAKISAAAVSLQQQLECLKAESEGREREARQSSQALQGKLQEAIRRHELMEQQVQAVSASEAQKGEEVVLLRTSLEELRLQNSKLREDMMQVSAALQCAREEHANCYVVAQRLSELSNTLGTVQQRVLEVENELVSAKADHAQRSDDLVQQNKLLAQERVGLDKKLTEASLQAERHKEALEAAASSVQQLEAEKTSLMGELQCLRLKLEAVQREQELGRTQTELLQGKVDEVSRAKEVAVREQTRHREEAARLQRTIADLTTQVGDLQQKVKSSEQRAARAVEDGGAERVRREGLEADLLRLERENRQMKSQFNSAVELMEARASEQALSLTKVEQGRMQKEVECTSLREQLGSESRQGALLKEKVTKLTADCQVWSERCRLLEQEQLDLKRRLAGTSSEVELLRQTALGAQTERDAFYVERDLLQRNVQEQESRTLELMGHVTAISREKEVLEAQVRELGRKLGTNEELRRQLSSQLQEREGLVSSSDRQQTEIENLTEAKASLEHDRSQLMASQAVLEGQVKELQTALAHLQQQFNQVQSEVEVRRKDAGKSALVEELQRKLSEVEQTHSQHIIKLQHSLREEIDGRQAAERALTELRGDVSIGMEDTSPVMLTQGSRDNFAAYLQIATTQFQRFIRNPNIVLTRLLRTTPRTKLLFMMYFVVLHLFVLYFIVA